MFSDVFRCFQMFSDGGTPDPQTSSTIITFNFDSPCLHMIDQSNGRITSLFLCDVNLAPMSLNLAVGETLDLTCSAVSNLDVSYQFLHNSSVVAEDAGPNLVESMSVSVDLGIFKVTQQSSLY